MGYPSGVIAGVVFSVELSTSVAIGLTRCPIGVVVLVGGEIVCGVVVGIVGGAGQGLVGWIRLCTFGGAFDVGGIKIGYSCVGVVAGGLAVSGKLSADASSGWVRWSIGVFVRSGGESFCRLGVGGSCCSGRARDDELVDGIGFARTLCPIGVGKGSFVAFGFGGGGNGGSCLGGRTESLSNRGPFAGLFGCVECRS
jgi:Na+/melibiose symporter-like transporter